jgi:uracil phosphoribosyltransferase
MGSNDMMLAKPAHQISLEEAYPNNIVILPKRGQLSFLMTKIRDASTPRAEFIFHSERLIRLLIEEGKSNGF